MAAAPLLRVAADMPDCRYRATMRVSRSLIAFTNPSMDHEPVSWTIWARGSLFPGGLATEAAAAGGAAATGGLGLGVGSRAGGDGRSRTPVTPAIAATTTRAAPITAAAGRRHHGWPPARWAGVGGAFNSEETGGAPSAAESSSPSSHASTFAQAWASWSR